MCICSYRFHPECRYPRVVGKLKSISASAIFREHPEVKRELWGGHFWQVGYFVRTSGDQVTTDIIRNYIEYHKNEEKTPKQLKLFSEAPGCARGVHFAGSARMISCLSFASLMRIAIWPCIFMETGLRAKSVTADPKSVLPIDIIPSVDGFGPQNMPSFPTTTYLKILGKGN